MDNKFKTLQWETQNRVLGSLNKHPIQVKDKDMTDLFRQFNLTYPFNYSNFKLHIRNINIFVGHSVRKYYEK
jgi:hypothetical protein